MKVTFKILKMIFLRHSFVLVVLIIGFLSFVSAESCKDGLFLEAFHPKKQSEISFDASKNTLYECAGVLEAFIIDEDTSSSELKRQKQNGVNQNFHANSDGIHIDQAIGFSQSDKFFQSRISYLYLHYQAIRI
jgi:hypothetical protein